MSDAQAKVFLAIKIAERLREPYSYEELAADVGRSKSTVFKHVKALIRLGVVVKKPGARGLRIKRRAA